VTSFTFVHYRGSWVAYPLHSGLAAVESYASVLKNHYRRGSLGGDYKFPGMRAPRSRRRLRRAGHGWPSSQPWKFV